MIVMMSSCNCSTCKVFIRIPVGVVDGSSDNEDNRLPSSVLSLLELG